MNFIWNFDWILDAIFHLQFRKTWHTPSHSATHELVVRTLKSKVDVFAHLFDLVDGYFDLNATKAHLSKPQFGIIRRLPGVLILWSSSLEQHILGYLNYVVSRRPIRYVRDLARIWPYILSYLACPFLCNTYWSDGNRDSLCDEQYVRNI